MLRFALLALLYAVPTAAQPIHVENGSVETHQATPVLQIAFQRLLATLRAPAWLGYEAPATAGQHMCCYGSARQVGPCAGCRLDSMRSFTFRSRAGHVIPLETRPRLLVLFRAEAGRVARIHAISPECGIDLGGLTLHWLDAVRPAESLTLLGALVDAAPAEPVWEPALSALALHAEPGVDALLIRLARHAPRHEVRSQTLFWLSQRAGDKAVATIRQAIEDDPEIEVKRAAVFALSELPAAVGVPLLIEIARSHRHPEVRRQACFWLGESEDARALAFFEDLLLGPRPAPPP